ncbi:hypothetical protein HanIR_Chr13g0638721 [Helianthus annuus]|nr:hypothetical protein HanIR_Chr13g0638721 [Helianthus annuus]
MCTCVTYHDSYNYYLYVLHKLHEFTQTFVDDFQNLHVFQETSGCARPLLFKKLVYVKMYCVFAPLLPFEGFVCYIPSLCRDIRNKTLIFYLKRCCNLFKQYTNEILRTIVGDGGVCVYLVSVFMNSL